MVRKLLGAALLFGCCLFLASCKIDATAPLRTFDIVNTAQSGEPIPVNAIVTAAFASATWCEDEGTMAIREIGSTAVSIRQAGCAKAGHSAIGKFQVSTNLVRTKGAKNPQTVVEEVLDADIVRFAVFPHAKHGHLLSVGIFLNVAKLEAAKTKLLAMPVFKRGGDTQEIIVNLSVNVVNDLPKMAKFYLTDVAADADGGSGDAVLELPQGGTELITLDPVSFNKLMQQGWVNFFTLDTR